MKKAFLILFSFTIFCGCKKEVAEITDLSVALPGTYVGSYKSSKGFQSATYEVVITNTKINTISIKGVNANFPNSAILMEVPNIETAPTDAAIPDTPVATNKVILNVIKDTYSGIVIEGKSNPPGAYGGFYYEVGTKKMVNIFFKSYKIEDPDNVTEIKFEGVKK